MFKWLKICMSSISLFQSNCKCSTNKCNKSTQQKTSTNSINLHPEIKSNKWAQFKAKILIPVVIDWDRSWSRCEVRLIEINVVERDIKSRALSRAVKRDDINLLSRVSSFLSHWQRTPPGAKLHIRWHNSKTPVT